jgi:hypothetical protein
LSWSCFFKKSILCLKGFPTKKFSKYIIVLYFLFLQISLIKLQILHDG